MKKACQLLSLLFCLFMVTQAYADTQKPKPLHIAFNNPGFADKGFWKDVSDTMRAAANRFNIELTIWYGNRDPNLIRENANQIFESDTHFDYLIIVNEYQQLAGFLRKAERKKIPTLFLLNTLSEQQSALVGNPGEVFHYWLGSLIPDNKKAGYEMASSLQVLAQQKKWAPPFPLFALSGDNKTPASLYRNAGMDSFLRGNPYINEMARSHTNWSRDNAFHDTARLLESSATPPRLIWAANDNIGLGAIDAMAQKGLVAGRDFAVAGLNWSPEGLKAVRNQQFTMTHGGHFFAGAWSMVVLYDHSQGQKLDIEINFPMEAITLQNIDEFESKLGSRDWSKINFARFSKSENPSLPTYDFSLKNLLAATER